jgi:hypothetical protein
MLFLLGAMSCERKLFDRRPKNKTLYFAIACTIWIPVVSFRYFHLNTVMNPGTFVFSEMADMLLMWSSFHLSLAGLMFVMVCTFWFYLDRQGDVGRELSANSYNVYIIHTIVIGIVAFLIRDFDVPSVLKFVIVTVTTYVMSNALIFFYRRVLKSYLLAKNINHTRLKMVKNTSMQT